MGENLLLSYFKLYPFFLCLVVTYLSNSALQLRLNCLKILLITIALTNLFILVH